LEEAVQFLGGRVNLVVNTLTVGGAPTDTHADRSAVQEWTRLLARRNELAVCGALVRVGGGVQRGKHQLTGFKLLEPSAQLERLTGLLANIRDPDYWLGTSTSPTGSNGHRICPEPSTSGSSSTCSSTTSWLAACSSSTAGG